MSLEQTLEQTNELLKQVITILSTGVTAGAELGQAQAADAKPTRTRKTKTEETPATTNVTTAPNNVLGTVEGDPVGTRYWLIEKHNTVYKQAPGEPEPTLAGAVITTAADYLAKKAQFEALSPVTTSSAPAASTAPAAAPAPSTPAASTVSSQPSEQTQGDVPFATIVERITVVNKSPAEGHGRNGVLAILKKWLPNDPQPTVTKLQPLGKNAEILADIEALLAPAAAPAAPADDFDPLA